MAALAGAVTVNLATPHAPLSHKVFFTVVAAGAGLAPDIDTPGSRIGRSYGLATSLLAHAVRRVSGGHREATHEIPGEAVTAGGAGICVAFIHDRAAQWILGVLLAILLASVLEMARVHRLKADLLAASAAAAVVVFRFDLGALAWAILLGMAVHVAGDLCTKHGGTPLKPFWDGKVWLLPYRMRLSTGHGVERFAVAPVMVAGLIAALVWTSGYGPVLLHLHPAQAIHLAGHLSPDH